MNSYYQTWHNRRREPRGPISCDEARRRLAAGEQLCVVVEDIGHILRTVDFSPYGGITASVLREDREASRKLIYERHAGRVFLSQTFDFEYDDDGSFVSTVWTACSEAGDARTETILRGHSTSRVVEAKEDPRSRWSDLPTLESISALCIPK